MPPIAYHLVARARPTLYPLKDRDLCVDLWRRLREEFPRSAACVLMPNHIHLLVVGARVPDAEWRMGVLLRAWCRRFSSGRPTWTPVPAPEPIPDVLHLKRQIRYVHLNPCRSGLTKDPLSWEWSTHRDIVGCVSDPWPDLDFLAEIFRTSRGRLGEVAHRYISSDPSVAVSGTPPLQPAEGFVLKDLATVLRAAATSRREEFQTRRGSVRTLAVHTANYLRMAPQPNLLNMVKRTWERTLHRPMADAEIQHVLRILADPRCRPTHRG